MSTKNADFYDADMRQNKECYSTGMYKKRNTLFTSMISQYKPKRVFEFAGAEGQLAQFILWQNSQLELYVWSDFSQEAFNVAKERLNQFKQCQMHILDIDKDYRGVPWERFDTVISTSLEHMVHDLEILREIKPDTLVCLALPNFKAEGHMRTFPNVTDIFNRYANLLQFLNITIIPNMPNSTLRYVMRLLIQSVNLEKLAISTGLMHPEKHNVRYLIIAKKKAQK